MRKIGDEFEAQVSDDLGIRKTNMSGAKFDNGDLSNSEIIIECKVKSTSKSFQSCSHEVSKVIKQAIKHNKEWLYIQKTKDKSFVVMDYNYFLELWTNLNHV